MRKPIVTLSLTSMAIAVLAMAMLGFVGDASAGTIKLQGQHSAGEIGAKCSAADGTFTGDPMSGGFGCKTDKGRVDCTKDGECWGTCDACGKRLIGPFIRGVLGRPNVGRPVVKTQ